MVRERLAVAFLALVALASCDGGAGGDRAQFCDEAGERSGAFRDPSGEVSPTIIATLRELAAQAPGEVTGEFETVSEASSQEELDRALAGIEEYLTEECGLEVSA